MKTLKKILSMLFLIVLGLIFSQCNFYKWQVMENNTEVDSKFLKEGTEVYVYLNVSETLWRLKDPVINSNGWSGTVICQDKKSPRITGTKEERLRVNRLMLYCHDQAFVSGEKVAISNKDILQIKEYRYDSEQSNSSTIVLALVIGASVIVVPLILMGPISFFSMPTFSGF
jgi:hypothetical protein